MSIYISLKDSNDQDQSERQYQLAQLPSIKISNIHKQYNDKNHCYKLTMDPRQKVIQFRGKQTEATQTKEDLI